MNSALLRLVTFRAAFCLGHPLTPDLPHEWTPPRPRRRTPHPPAWRWQRRHRRGGPARRRGGLHRRHARAAPREGRWHTRTPVVVRRPVAAAATAPVPRGAGPPAPGRGLGGVPGLHPAARVEL